MSKFLGIDTSCYTTSLAVYDSEKGLICEERIILKVKMGGRRLSQSNMVYQHVRNLPVLMQRISPSLGDVSVIGVSSFPRRRADSFMPAFLVGKDWQTHYPRQFISRCINSVIKKIMLFLQSGRHPSYGEKIFI